MDVQRGGTFFSLPNKKKTSLSKRATESPPQTEPECKIQALQLLPAHPPPEHPPPDLCIQTRYAIQAQHNFLVSVPLSVRKVNPPFPQAIFSSKLLITFYTIHTIHSRKAQFLCISKVCFCQCCEEIAPFVSRS